MQVDTKVSYLARCRCGFKPDHYSTGYGPRPYYVQCTRCGHHSNDWGDLGGWWFNIIWFWNKIAGLSNRQLKALKAKEGDDFIRMPAELYEEWSPS